MWRRLHPSPQPQRCQSLGTGPGVMFLRWPPLPNSLRDSFHMRFGRAAWPARKSGPPRGGAAPVLGAPAGPRADLCFSFSGHLWRRLDAPCLLPSPSWHCVGCGALGPPQCPRSPAFLCSADYAFTHIHPGTAGGREPFLRRPEPLIPTRHRVFPTKCIPLRAAHGRLPLKPPGRMVRAGAAGSAGDAATPPCHAPLF